MAAAESGGSDDPDVEEEQGPCCKNGSRETYPLILAELGMQDYQQSNVQRERVTATEEVVEM